MRDRHSQFVIAGGPIGAVHPRFATWHQAFRDNLDITVQLSTASGSWWGCRIAIAARRSWRWARWR
ncbi:hypothetical protein JYK14_13590 [Siccirubricoccus sp. KC 17139]|uniref:Uncharacterized protein n=1 Tax=Siccirubricoccus soli TaxID=2899147 RepID=A0ABT1D5I7_9PROT|nr:hypothetical protein [Siccirubricoccus soli]MCO6417188.1 hypothetical protein [Siccirubricoccus soli]MCP2683323.1 hypothetical protein [Siccirubricoccus soli]